jgi:hypothetical protein
MAKIKVCMCESYTTITAKEWIEIDSDMYEETKGMSAEELEDYIQENYMEMKPTPNVTAEQTQWITSLSNELDNMDIMHDKIKNEDYWLEFKDVDECEDCDEDYDVSEEEE